jgi:hypothetical protein
MVIEEIEDHVVTEVKQDVKDLLDAKVLKGTLDVQVLSEKEGVEDQMVHWDQEVTQDLEDRVGTQDLMVKQDHVEKEVLLD